MRPISSARRRRGIPLAGVGVVLIFILALWRILFPSVFFIAASPFISAASNLSGGVGSFFSGFADARSLAKQRDALLGQVDMLSQENAVLSAKVADLTALIGSAPSPAPGIAAGVLARPPVSPYDTLVVAAGSDNGVSLGDVAYAASGIPLGVVESVSGSVSRITLLSASAMETAAWLGSAHTPIVLRGEGGGSFSAQVPKSASSTGEEVYVAGAGSLPVGVVAGATGDPSSPYLTLEVKGAVSPFSIASVLIRPGPASWPRVASSTP